MASKHLPLSVSRLTPNRIDTADDKAVSISWQDSRDENPYQQAEDFAAYIVRACNSHDALVKALHKIVNNWGNLHPKDLHQVRAALSTAESKK